MTEDNQITELIKETEMYHCHEILGQTKWKYSFLKKMLAENHLYSKDEDLNRFLKDKINIVDIGMEEVNKGDIDAPRLDDETEALIGNLFSFSNNNEMSAIESAVVLAKFGQYKKALDEFTALLEAGCFPLISAKNILRCHVALSSPEKAVAQYSKWEVEGNFTCLDLAEIKGFLSSILGRNIGLLTDSEAIDRRENNVTYHDDKSCYMEVYSICLFMKNAREKMKKADIKITCQEENKVSFILGRDQKKLADLLLAGASLSRILCFSRESVFYTNAVITRKSRIASGPLEDCYSYDFLLEEPFYSASYCLQ